MTAYGHTCPFCKFSVEEDERTCPECGAAKGTRADLGGLWIRFVFWAPTVGLALYGTIGATIDFWHAGKYVFSVLAILLGSLAVKGLAYVWKKLFGTLQDPMWVKRT